jgi:hypothetical protein
MNKPDIIMKIWRVRGRIDNDGRVIRLERETSQSPETTMRFRFEDRVLGLHTSL